MDALVSYVIPSDDKATHRVMQHVHGKGIKEAISQYGDILCESCDYVLASEGSTLKVGDECKRCKCEVVYFLPIGSSIQAELSKEMEQASRLLSYMTTENRLTVMRLFCKDCGEASCSRHCENDE